VASDGPGEAALAAKKRRRFEFVYRAGLLLKGIDGTFELLAGLALWFFPDALARLVEPFAHTETGPHPLHGFVAYWAGRADHELVSGHHTFVIVFLLLHGVVKLVLVYCLLREFHWVYPWALAVLGAFVVYQAYVLVRSPTIGMALLTLLDVVIVWLVWREWRQIRRRDAPVRGLVP